MAALAGAVGVHDDGAAEALEFHLLEVAGDGGLVDIAIEPPPVGAEAGFRGRVEPRVGGGSVRSLEERRKDGCQIDGCVAEDSAGKGHGGILESGFGAAERRVAEARIL